MEGSSYDGSKSRSYAPSLENSWLRSLRQCGDSLALPAPTTDSDSFISAVAEMSSYLFTYLVSYYSLYVSVMVIYCLGKTVLVDKATPRRRDNAWEVYWSPAKLRESIRIQTVCTDSIRKWYGPIRILELAAQPGTRRSHTIIGARISVANV